MPNCENCADELNLCKICNKGFENVDGLCLAKGECPWGSFPKEKNVCEKCHAACTHCFGATENDCYDCANGYFFLGEKCEKCDSGCKTCKFDDDLCESCESGFVLRGHKCEKTCDQDEYFDINEARCKNCHHDCGKCINSRENCLSCADEVMFDYQQSSQGCLPSCPSGFYINLNSLDYANYINNLFSYFLERTSSVDFAFSKKCDKCSYPCKECMIDSDICTACIDGFYLKNQKCVQNCDVGYFVDTDPYTKLKTCVRCAAFCDKCVDEFTCTECDNRFTKIGDDCFLKNQTVSFKFV